MWQIDWPHKKRHPQFCGYSCSSYGGRVVTGLPDRGLWGRDILGPLWGSGRGRGGRAADKRRRKVVISHAGDFVGGRRGVLDSFLDFEGSWDFFYVRTQVLLHPEAQASIDTRGALREPLLQGRAPYLASFSTGMAAQEAPEERESCGHCRSRS